MGDRKMIYLDDTINAFDCSIGGVPVDSVKYVSEYADKMMSRINALPPAQPEIAKEYDLKKIYNIYVKIAQAHFVYQPSKPKAITAMPFDWIEVQNLLEKYLEDHGADFDALCREYVSENVKDDHLPSIQPETYKEKLKEIADELSEKFAYLNTCPNERDIILGYLGVKRPREIHCDTDCTNTKCESNHHYTKSLTEPEIIRCRECKHYDGRPCGIVDWYNTADDFCSRAERRGEQNGQ